jgi:hypothetical protein
MGLKGADSSLASLKAESATAGLPIDFIFPSFAKEKTSSRA